MKTFFLIFLLISIANQGVSQDPRYIPLVYLGIENVKLFEKHEKDIGIDNFKDNKYLMTLCFFKLYKSAYVIRRYRTDENKIVKDSMRRFGIKVTQYLDKKIHIILLSHDWDIRSFKEKERDKPMIKIVLCLFPTSKLKVSKKQIIDSDSLMKLSFIFSKPPYMGKKKKEKIYKTFRENLKNIPIEYKAGKVLNFVFDSELKYKMTESDLPKQEIVLDIEVK